MASKEFSQKNGAGSSSKFAFNEQTIRLFFEYYPIPILVCDCVTHKISQANEALLEIYGYLAAEFNALILDDLFF